MDSYDKLKPYGICINGCIDGFSRHIIYLQAGSTSSDPKVVAGYFLQGLEQVNGCPKTLRCDLGTKNRVVERIQNSLHQLFNENPGNKPCLLYGKSCHNQRIESWWGILRKHCSQFWMNLFEMLKEDNYFGGTFIDKSLIQFCFMELIQKNLDQVVLEWNIHKIRRLKNTVSPSGRPCIMYEMPSIYKTRSYMVGVPNFAIEALRSECKFLKYPCDQDVFDLCNILLVENNWEKGSDPHEAVDLYIQLRNVLKSILNI
ncbi:unnamed protein product [Psylliodes chrysocephalus]|uniref:Integrase core domain-containing protein n=1 Tax=Psylliodes chrysocephalus TaxID=3402493 RepID=A0A9P0GKS5_9CUCU|nr:unnamed protein product [Psylliodes chrysocephala]